MEESIHAIDRPISIDAVASHSIVTTLLSYVPHLSQRRRICPVSMARQSYHCVPAEQLHRALLTVLTWKYNKYNYQTNTHIARPKCGQL